MDTITHREYLMRLAYLDAEWDRPSRSDWYVMLLIHTVRNLFNRKAVNFTGKDVRLKFGGSKPKKLTKAEKKTAMEHSKSRWFGMLQIGRK